MKFQIEILIFLICVCAVVGFPLTMPVISFILTSNEIVSCMKHIAWIGAVIFHYERDQPIDDVDRFEYSATLKSLCDNPRNSAMNRWTTSLDSLSFLLWLL